MKNQTSTPKNMQENTFSIEGNLCDWQKRLIYPVRLEISEGKINNIQLIEENLGNERPYILPGFTDAHVHIESSLLIPSEFARLAVVHGTVGTISDPHEIANVCGKEGIIYMLDNAEQVPFRFHFGVPSCVPATPFETAGAVLDAEAVGQLLQDPRLPYLAEMMNYPGVLGQDAEVMQKITYAKSLGKPIDGHAPGLSGENLQRYIQSGIQTDHECVGLEEAIEKVSMGMKILIRQGSAARNFEALIPLLKTHPEQVMFCSDDKHPDSLLDGHINTLFNQALALGYEFWDVLLAACVNPVLHYKTGTGLLRTGDAADFMVTRSIDNIIHPTVYIDGVKVAENGVSLIASVPGSIINQFESHYCPPELFRLSETYASKPAIAVLDGQIITGKFPVEYRLKDSFVLPDLDQDVIYLAVVNRYRKAPPALAMVHGTGIQQGALASSVAHDSHNIVVCGTTAEDMAAAVQLVMEHQGGLAISVGEVKHILPLPVAGLMSNQDGFETAHSYIQLDQIAKQYTQTTLSAPFMTLSFLALPVIPHLKLSDLGLFDVDQFAFC